MKDVWNKASSGFDKMLNSPFIKQTADNLELELSGL